MYHAGTLLIAARAIGPLPQAPSKGAWRCVPLVLLLAALMGEASAQDGQAKATDLDQTLALAPTTAAESPTRFAEVGAPQVSEAPAASVVWARATESKAPQATGQRRIQLWMSHGVHGASDMPRALFGALSSHIDLAHSRGPTRAGVEWKAAKSSFGLERGAVGVRLDSSYRLALRVRRGGVGLFVRGQF